jgi:hypothetical protein
MSEFFCQLAADQRLRAVGSLMWNCASGIALRSCV